MRSSFALALGLALFGASQAFTVVPKVARTAPAPTAGRQIFSSPPEAESESVALVKVSPENVEASVGVAGALTGLVVFGNPLFSVFLAALGNYATKQEGDVGEAFRGVGTALINSVNFAVKLNERYSVTDKVGSTVNNGFQNLKAKDTSDAKILTKVEDAFENFKSTVSGLNEEYDLKSKAREFVYAAGDISTQAIEKATDLNSKYKLSDQATEKAKEIVDKAKTKAKDV